MEPGSVLFVPRGTWHATESGGDSLSVSIGLYLSSAADAVLEQLQLLLLQDSEWRRPLHGGWGEGLPEDCAALKAEDVLTGPLPPEQRLARISPESRFQKTPHSRLEHAPTPPGRAYPCEALVIIIADPNYGERGSTRLEIAPEAASVFRWMAERRAAFSAGELAERFPVFPFAQHREILEAVARSGLIHALWFPVLPSGSRSS